MELKLTGKIKKFESSTEIGKLTLELTGKDSFGKQIRGEIDLYVSPAITKDIKLNDLLSITICNKNE